VQLCKSRMEQVFGGMYSCDMRFLDATNLGKYMDPKDVTVSRFFPAHDKGGYHTSGRYNGEPPTR